MKTKKQVRSEIQEVYNQSHEDDFIGAFHTYLEQTIVDLELENMNLRTKLGGCK